MIGHGQVCPLPEIISQPEIVIFTLLRTHARVNRAHARAFFRGGAASRFRIFSQLTYLNNCATYSK